MRVAIQRESVGELGGFVVIVGRLTPARPDGLHRGVAGQALDRCAIRGGRGPGGRSAADAREHCGHDRRASLPIDARKGPMHGLAVSRAPTTSCARRSSCWRASSIRRRDQTHHRAGRIGAGYAGIAIDHHRGGQAAANLQCQGRSSAGAPRGGARLGFANHQTYVQHGKIAVWGLAAGGPRRSWHQIAARPLGRDRVSTGRASRAPSPGPTATALDEIEDVRTPLLLVFGGHDELGSVRPRSPRFANA